MLFQWPEQWQGSDGDFLAGITLLLSSPAVPTEAIGNGKGRGAGGGSAHVRTHTHTHLPPPMFSAWQRGHKHLFGQGTYL